MLSRDFAQNFGWTSGGCGARFGFMERSGVGRRWVHIASGHVWTEFRVHSCMEFGFQHFHSWDGLLGCALGDSKKMSETCMLQEEFVEALHGCCVPCPCGTCCMANLIEVCAMRVPVRACSIARPFGFVELRMLKSLFMLFALIFVSRGGCPYGFTLGSLMGS